MTRPCNARRGPRPTAGTTRPCHHSAPAQASGRVPGPPGPARLAAASGAAPAGDSGDGRMQELAPARTRPPGTSGAPGARGARAGGAASRGRAWLGGATCALAVLAAAAATVSWNAQYVLARAARHDQVIAGLEAGIPDAGAMIFAALGIALALHGKRALRPRALNLACVGLSLVLPDTQDERGGVSAGERG